MEVEASPPLSWAMQSQTELREQLPEEMQHQSRLFHLPKTISTLTNKMQIGFKSYLSLEPHHFQQIPIHYHAQQIPLYYHAQQIPLYYHSRS
jgi:hypothetical protein